MQISENILLGLLLLVIALPTTIFEAPLETASTGDMTLLWSLISFIKNLIPGVINLKLLSNLSLKLLTSKGEHTHPSKPAS